ncbi:MAG: fumarylacetoacetate hydrolase family protein [Chloroflexi bacterium]|nr:fumarylacetoacetate hydrolase family protein [Chloroflexota bacterium]
MARLQDLPPGRHLPWGVVRVHGGAPQPALRDGDDALLLGELSLPADTALLRAVAAPDLNALIELGPGAWRAIQDAAAAAPDRARIACRDCTPVLPIRVPDYVDFYASLEHATNFGRIFRPGAPPVRENWRHMPVGYHGRASAIVVSGTQIRRPSGQAALGTLGHTAQLDLECELGYVCGPSVRGPIPVDQADEHIFGVVLVNDWSARDIQRLEYEPLGPFLGKSFATSMSAWITPLPALAEARTAPPPQDPAPAPYLAARAPWLLDVGLEVELNGTVISRPRAAGLYWTPAQMIAHLTVNGARLNAGDLLATGTISGAEPGSEGSLAERFGGERWLADGDEVVLRGRAGAVALGEVRGRIRVPLHPTELL